MSALVQRVVNEPRFEAGERRIEVSAPAAVVTRVDPLRLEQVLMNLLTNALKFGPPETPVEVEVRTPDPDEVQISVRDYGMGIPEARRARIFDRFYQAHGEGNLGGMGLGLYISRQIIELHGGRLELEVPEDGGSRLVVHLPGPGAPGGRTAGDDRTTPPG